jgi:RNA polymerase sigma-70 factor (ECF subfamily)
MYRITANCAATLHERRRRHVAIGLDDHTEELVDLSPERDPELRATAALLRRDIETALRRLPDRLRTVLVLRDVYDLAHDEIAELLGITGIAREMTPNGFDGFSADTFGNSCRQLRWADSRLL